MGRRKTAYFSLALFITTIVFSYAHFGSSAHSWSFETLSFVHAHEDEGGNIRQPFGYHAAHTHSSDHDECSLLSFFTNLPGQIVPEIGIIEGSMPEVPDQVFVPAEADHFSENLLAIAPKQSPPYIS